MTLTEDCGCRLSPATASRPQLRPPRRLCDRCNPERPPRLPHATAARRPGPRLLLAFSSTTAGDRFLRLTLAASHLPLAKKSGRAFTQFPPFSASSICPVSTGALGVATSDRSAGSGHTAARTQAQNFAAAAARCTTGVAPSPPLSISSTAMAAAASSDEGAGRVSPHTPSESGPHSPISEVVGLGRRRPPLSRPRPSRPITEITEASPVSVAAHVRQSAHCRGRLGRRRGCCRLRPSGVPAPDPATAAFAASCRKRCCRVRGSGCHCCEQRPAVAGQPWTGWGKRMRQFLRRQVPRGLPQGVGPLRIQQPSPTTPQSCPPDPEGLTAEAASSCSNSLAVAASNSACVSRRRRSRPLATSVPAEAAARSWRPSWHSRNRSWTPPPPRVSGHRCSRRRRRSVATASSLKVWSAPRFCGGGLRQLCRQLWPLARAVAAAAGEGCARPPSQERPAAATSSPLSPVRRSLPLALPSSARPPPPAAAAAPAPFPPRRSSYKRGCQRGERRAGASSAPAV